MISINIVKHLDGAEGKMELRLQLSVAAGQLATLYGPSGAGKSSTFRLLAGLLTPDEGRIVVGEQVWFDAQQKINLRPQQRQLGFVFQDYALFPNMTILENLQFAAAQQQDAQMIKELIDFMELAQLQHRKPGSLSGGQQQRVALARALVQRPKILLLDEPLSALDLSIRSKLQDYLLRLHRHYGLTTLLISHDLTEIFKLADCVYQLEQGKLIAQGTPDELFIQKKLSGKFRFTGELLKIEPHAENFILSLWVQSNIIQLELSAEALGDLQVGDKVLLLTDTFQAKVYRLS